MNSADEATDEKQIEALSSRVHLCLKLVIVGVLLIAVSAIVVRITEPTTVTVENVDSVTLKCVTVHVTGNSYYLGDIGPGISTTVIVEALGESSVWITVLDEKGTQQRFEADIYFEGHDCRGNLDVELTGSGIRRFANGITYRHQF